MADPGMFTAADERLAEGEAGERFPRQEDAVSAGGFAGGSPGGSPGGEAAPDDTVGAATPAAGRRLPLVATVLLADALVGLVTLAVLVVIGLQRLDGSTFDQRHTAYVEDVTVFFVVGAVFIVVAILLLRSGRRRVALVQLAVALSVFGLGGYAAATGSPGPNSSLYTVVPEEPTSTLPPLDAPSDAPSGDPAGSPTAASTTIPATAASS